jgi:hypothetical protein
VWGYSPPPDATAPDLMSKVYEGGIITYLHKVDGPLVHAVIETPAVGVAGRDMKERMLRVRPAARCAGSAASCTASTRRTRRPCAWGVRRAARAGGGGRG